MKYKDSYKHLHTSRDKYGNKVDNPNSYCEKMQRKRDKERRKKLHTFILRLSKIDSYWVKTLTNMEKERLFSIWKFDCVDNTFENFVKDKKNYYGNLEKSRDLKLEELLEDD